MKKTSRLLSLLLTVLMMVGMVSLGIGSQTASAAGYTTGQNSLGVTQAAVAWWNFGDIHHFVDDYSYDLSSTGNTFVVGVIYWKANALCVFNGNEISIGGGVVADSGVLHHEGDSETARSFTYNNASTKFAVPSTQTCYAKAQVYMYYYGDYWASATQSVPLYLSCSHQGGYTTSSTVDASCTAGGYTAYHCNLCGANWTGNNTGALGHASANNRSCTSNETCSRCGTQLNPAYGHSSANNRSCTQAETCSRCGTQLNPAYGHTPGAAATCTTAQTCTRCDYVYQAALDHDYIYHGAQAATCTAIGWEAYQTCSRCDYTTYEEIPALDHDYVNHDAQTATCTAIGWEAYQTCSRCDYTTYNEIPAIGHTDAEWVEVTPATCTSVGLKTKTCPVCLEVTASEEIAILEHTSVTDEAVPATCTETGLTEGSHCSVCTAVLVEQKEIPALGHDYVDHDAQDATCTAKGWKEYQTCSRCDYTTYKEIPALVWHNIEEVDDVKKCTVCLMHYTGKLGDKIYKDGVETDNLYGIIDGKYYEDGAVRGICKLVYQEDAYYYIRMNGSIYMGTIRLGSSALEGTAFEPGTYTFDSYGKMVVPEKKNGIINGKYYENDAVKGLSKVVEQDGDYYYITKQGTVFVGTVSLGSTALADTPFKAGTYTFLKDGKMVQPVKKNGIVDGKYYENDKIVCLAKVIKVEEDYYYITKQGTVFVGTVSLGSTALADTPFKAGTYTFLEDGKMVQPVIKNGIVDGKYYVDDVLQKLGKVIELDGDYYYISKQGKVFVGTVSLSSTALADTTFKAGKYTFGSDGKMIIK